MARNQDFTDDFNFDALDSSRPYEGFVPMDDDVDEKGKETDKPAKKPKSFLDFSQFGKRGGASAASGIGQAIETAIPGIKKSENFFRQIKTEVSKAYNDIHNDFIDRSQLIQGGVEEFQDTLGNAAPNAVRAPLNRAMNTVINADLDKYRRKGDNSFSDDFATPSAEQAKQDSRNSKLNEIANIFGGANATNTGVVGGMFTKAVDKIVSKSTEVNLKVMGNLGSSLTFQTEFIKTTFTAYLKKDLELKYRTLFATEDLLEALKLHSQATNMMLDKIRHNTGLPDANKSTIQDDILNSVKDGFKNKATDFFSNYASKLGKNIKDRYEDTIGTGLDLLGMMIGGDAADSLKQILLQGKSVSEELADRTLGMVGQSATKQILKRLDPNAAKYLESFLSNANTDIPLLLDSIARGKRPSGTENIPDNVWNTIAGVISTVAPTMDRSGIKLKNLNTTRDLTAEGVITNKFITTVEEIIPTYLRLQTKYLESIATGKHTDEVQERMFSYTQGKMVTTSELFDEFKRSAFNTDQLSAEISSRAIKLQRKEWFANHFKDDTKSGAKVILDLSIMLQNMAGAYKYEYSRITPEMLPWFRDVALHNGKLSDYNDNKDAREWYDLLFENVEDPVAVSNAVFNLMSEDANVARAFSNSVKDEISAAMTQGGAGANLGEQAYKYLNLYGLANSDYADKIYQLDERGNRIVSNNSFKLADKGLINDAYRESLSRMDRSKIISGEYARDYNLKTGEKYNHFEKMAVKFMSEHENLFAGTINNIFDRGVDALGAGARTIFGDERVDKFNEVRDTVLDKAFGGIANTISDTVNIIQGADGFSIQNNKRMREWLGKQVTIDGTSLSILIPLLFKKIPGGEYRINSQLDIRTIIDFCKKKPNAIKALYELSYLLSSNPTGAASWIARSIPPVLSRVLNKVAEDQFELILQAEDPVAAMRAVVSDNVYVSSREQFDKVMMRAKDKYTAMTNRFNDLRKKYGDFTPDELRSLLKGGIKEVNAKRRAQGKAEIDPNDIPSMRKMFESARNSGINLFEQTVSKFTSTDSTEGKETATEDNKQTTSQDNTSTTSTANFDASSTANETQHNATSTSSSSPSTAPLSSTLMGTTSTAPETTTGNENAESSETAQPASADSGVRGSTTINSTQENFSKQFSEFLNTVTSAINRRMERSNDTTSEQREQGGLFEDRTGSLNLSGTTDIVDALHEQTAILKDIRAAAKNGGFGNGIGVMGRLFRWLGIGKNKNNVDAEEVEEPTSGGKRSWLRLPKFLRVLYDNPVGRAIGALASPFVAAARVTSQVGWGISKFGYGFLSSALTNRVGEVRRRPKKNEDVSDAEVLISEEQFRDGVYSDPEAKNQLTSIYDIRGPVYDRNGEMLISKEDIKYGLVDSKGRPIKTWAHTLGRLVRKGVAAVGRGIWSTVRYTLKHVKTPLSMMWSAMNLPITAASAAMIRFRDIYSRRNPKQVLVTAKDLEAGYVCYENGEPPKDCYSITKPLYWRDIPENGSKAGQTAISQEDIDAGLIDNHGKLLNTLFRRANRALWPNIASLTSFSISGAITSLKLAVTGSLEAFKSIFTAKDPYIDVYVRHKGIIFGREPEPRLLGINIRKGVEQGEPEYFYANGKIVTSAYGIEGAVYNQDGTKTYITEDELDRLVDVNGRRLTKWRSRSLAGKIFNAGIEVTSAIATGVWGIAKGAGAIIGGTANFLFKKLGKAVKSIGSIGMDALLLSTLAMREFAATLLGRSKLITREDLMDIVGRRLDNIYDLLNWKLAKGKHKFGEFRTISGDADNDGIRDNSYQDKKKRRAKQKEAEAARANDKYQKETLDQMKKMNKNLRGLRGNSFVTGAMSTVTDLASNLFKGIGGKFAGSAIATTAGAAASVAGKGVLTTAVRTGGGVVLKLVTRHPVGAALTAIGAAAIYGIAEWTANSDFDQKFLEVRAALYGFDNPETASDTVEFIEDKLLDIINAGEGWAMDKKDLMNIARSIKLITTPTVSYSDPDIRSKLAYVNHWLSERVLPIFKLYITNLNTVGAD